MTSLRQIQANRSNSGKSTGPRTAAGKLQTGRNARRHGLAALMSRVPVRSPELDSFARELFGDDDPGVFAISLAVAHNEILLQNIRKIQMTIWESVEATADPDKAVTDLKRLERYERRVWANQKRQLRQHALLAEK